MILQNNCGKPQNSQFVKFKDNFLENAKEYKYLGCMININGSLVNSSLDLSKKDKKVLFSIKAYTSDFGQIPVKVACNLFDTLVKSILTYNSEIISWTPTLNCLVLHYVQKQVILKLMN